MTATSVQFAVARHILTALGFHYGREITSKTLAESVNAEPTFVVVSRFPSLRKPV